MTAQRIQIQADDAADPERLRKVLNDALLEVQERLEDVEAAKGIKVLDFVDFETGAGVGPALEPFSIDSGGLRVSCGDIKPTGLVLLRIENLTDSAVMTGTHFVHWRYEAGIGPAEGALRIDFVTGLDPDTRYRMRLGVTRE